ncbi:molybdopterin synthase catalytic subunit-like [Centruroides vittatus]|uniref:molybdopterin synthase catalytic subunit-like n=1 Tax=Centruroides vittatus TaxID=120091 RepID=UPI00350EF9CC
MDCIKITFEKLEVETIVNEVISPTCGGVSVFIGTTRDNEEGKKVLELQYEAYDAMALKEMRKISNEMRQKWPVKNIAIVHRKGTVPVGEASVVVAACSEHRKEAQEAVMWCMDALKEKVPIWKKEIYEDGCTWKENKECPWTK